MNQRDFYIHVLFVLLLSATLHADQSELALTHASQIAPGWVGIAWSPPPAETTRVRVMRRSRDGALWRDAVVLDPSRQFVTQRLDASDHPFVQYRVEAFAGRGRVAEIVSPVLGVGAELAGNGDLAWEAPLPLTAPEGIPSQVEIADFPPHDVAAKVMTFADPGGYGQRRIEVKSPWIWVRPAVRHEASLWFRNDGPVYPVIGIEVEGGADNSLMNWRNAIHVRDRVAGPWARHWTSFAFEGDQPVRFRFVIGTPRDRAAAFAVTGVSVVQRQVNDPMSTRQLTHLQQMRDELTSLGTASSIEPMQRTFVEASESLRELAEAARQPDLSPEQAMMLAAEASSLNEQMTTMYYQIKTRVLVTKGERE